MKAILEQLVSTLKAGVLAENPDLDLTVLGKTGHGKVRVKVHYKRENLVFSMVYREDLHKLELGSTDPVDQYLMVLQVGENPWTELPKKGIVNLKSIPGIVQRKPETTLPESLAVSDAVLGVLESFSRVTAYIRQWRANNGGTGVELIFVHRDEDGKRHVFEGVVNYYHHVDQAALVERLKANATAKLATQQ